MNENYLKKITQTTQTTKVHTPSDNYIVQSEFSSSYGSLSSKKTLYNKYEQIKKAKNWRHIAPNEIVLDCDDKENGDKCLRQIGLLMSNAGYNMEIWKAEVQKSYHIHIRNIPKIAELPKKQNEEYKKLLIQKYINETIKVLGYKPSYFDKIDFSSCILGHLIAEENKLHYKYKTPKLLIEIINADCQNFCDVEIYEQAQKTGFNKSLQENFTFTYSNYGISIIDIAQQFGLKVNNKMTLCPFHNDTNPSLSLNNEKGLFFCFGCHAKGNLIMFYAMLKKLNPEFKYKPSYKE